MVEGIQGFGNRQMPMGMNPPKPPYAELFQQNGISRQEVHQYLQEKGLSRQEVHQAIQNGENTFQELLEANGVPQEDITAYEEKLKSEGIPGRPPGPPPNPPHFAELKQYGLQPTGSLEGDLAAIALAKAQQQKQQQDGYNTNFLKPEILTNFSNRNV